MSIAATVGIPVITGVPTCIHDGFVALENLKVDQRFLLYLLKASEGRLRESGQSGSQMNVNTEIVKKLPVRIPVSPNEQVRIADALWDTDDLIAALEQLIVKKQAIKQGMMRQLLTGRVRLPGCSEPWSVGVSLSDICNRFAGYWGADVRKERDAVRAQVIRAGDISAEGDLTGWADRFFTSAQWGRASCRDDDVVITASGNGLGKTYYVDAAERLAASNFVRVLRPRQGVSGRFIAYLMKSQKADPVLEANTATSAYPNLLPSFFTTRWFDLPVCSEQLAIAQVLSDVDAEIDALRQRVAKAQSVKAGMMQLLLTGRVRLPMEVES